MSFNFTVVKKNHILAGAVTLMIVTAGYLNYKYDPNKAYDVEVTGRIEDNLGDAVYVDANGITQKFDNLDNSNYTYTDNGDKSVFNNTSTLNSGDNTLVDNSNQFNESGKADTVPVFSNLENNDEKVFKNIDDYFIATRIDRTNNYAEIIETYEDILESNTTSDEQKNKAEENIEKINSTRNSIMVAENLIKLKGFEDVVILVTENSINIVVNSNDLNSQEVAQIQSIVVNEFSADVANIHIMNYE